jgi:GNAT superfamily N-acetyltransferase
VASRPAAFANPVPLTGRHDLEKFDSGEPVLDEWLRKKALHNAVCHQDLRRLPNRSDGVIGYYALCMGQLLNRDAVGSMRRNMPTHIPAVILARLAVHSAWQRRGLGQFLLGDAVGRSLRAAQQVSARLVVVHAISPAAEAFYTLNGFTRLPTDTPTYALDLVKFANS